MAYPVPLQATTAIANFAIAIMVLFQALPREEAQSKAVRLERLIFEQIAADSRYYAIRVVLRLRKEQNAWARYVGSDDFDAQSDLGTIIRVVHATRLAQFEEDCQRGMQQVLRGGAGSDGPVAFLAKRWLSQISGKAIVRPDNLSEPGFEDLGLACFFFNVVMSGVVEGMKE